MATSAAAPPPTALNRLTSCGIAVSVRLRPGSGAWVGWTGTVGERSHGLWESRTPTSRRPAEAVSGGFLTSAGLGLALQYTRLTGLHRAVRVGLSSLLRSHTSGSSWGNSDVPARMSGFAVSMWLGQSTRPLGQLAVACCLRGEVHRVCDVGRGSVAPPRERSLKLAIDLLSAVPSGPLQRSAILWRANTSWCERPDRLSRAVLAAFPYGTGFLAAVAASAARYPRAAAVATS